MRKIFLALIASMILILATYEPKIFIGTENQAVAVANTQENLPLTINFTHSVQKTPVIEELEYRNGEFILLRTKYKSLAVRRGRRQILSRRRVVYLRRHESTL